jgi:DNA-nicking Smr family endonuclease
MEQNYVRISIMDEPENTLKHNPFERLNKLLKKKAKASRVAATKAMEVEKKGVAAPAENCAAAVSEESVFGEAMEGVTPIDRDKYYAGEKAAAPRPDFCAPQSEEHVIRQLDNLIKYGEGFIISKTPEYMEGTGHGIPPEFAERLHRGDFSIQAHLDLHGLNVAQAKEAFENFLRWALKTGKQGVLIIHGRGISSPGDPVLKTKVGEWLSKSHWRKWIIAFTSAQSYDGGSGATYVLLRSRPQSKRLKIG